VVIGCAQLAAVIDAELSPGAFTVHPAVPRNNAALAGAADLTLGAVAPIAALLTLAIDAELFRVAVLIFVTGRVIRLASSDQQHDDDRDAQGGRASHGSLLPAIRVPNVISDGPVLAAARCLACSGIAFAFRRADAAALRSQPVIPLIPLALRGVKYRPLGAAGSIPAELVTASASGLDPHIAPAMATWADPAGGQGPEGNKPRTVETTMQRLRRFFAEATKIAVGALTPACASKLYEALAGAVDSRRKILAEAKTFLRWCRDKGWTKTNALESIQGLGKRRRGKPQLTADEARKFLAKALELADDDEGAIAAAMALLMGMRASEIVERTVRNLDDEGRLLWITDAKTNTGVRRLEVPAQLQTHLQRLARARAPGIPSSHPARPGTGCSDPCSESAGRQECR
jgi:hypothetical protein